MLDRTLKYARLRLFNAGRLDSLEASLGILVGETLLLAVDAAGPGRLGLRDRGWGATVQDVHAPDQVGNLGGVLEHVLVELAHAGALRLGPGEFLLADEVGRAMGMDIVLPGLVVCHGLGGRVVLEELGEQELERAGGRELGLLAWPE